MAASIKGITIELNGDVTKLDQALKGVNATSKALNAELKEIEKQLKFNPGNTTLLEQQQRALASQVEETAKKLDTLKIAAQQAQQPPFSLATWPPWWQNPETSPNPQKGAFPLGESSFSCVPGSIKQLIAGRQIQAYQSSRDS